MILAQLTCFGKRLFLIPALVLMFVLFLSAQETISTPLEPIKILAGTQVNNVYVPPTNHSSETVGQRSVTINVNYNGSNWTPDVIAAFDYAVGIWEQILTSDVAIEIDATFEDLGAGVLGSAGANTISRNFSSSDPSYMGDTWYPAALANRLNGTDLSAQVDITASFSSTFPFYFGTDGATPSDRYDFVTVVLHEIGHGLGFLPSTQCNTVEGGYGILGNGVASPLIYDRFIIDGNGVLLTSFEMAVALNALGDYLQSDNLFWTSGSAASGAKLYAPFSYQTGSSIAHFDEATFNGTPQALMTPMLNFGEAIHDPGSFGVGLLNDIGWKAELITGVEDELRFHSFDWDCWSAPQCQGNVYELMGNNPKQEYNLGQTGHYAWTFIDEEPLNPLYTSHVFWELRILHSQGTYIHSGGNTVDYPIWNVTIDELPSNYTWKRNHNEQIRAELYLSGIDSEGYLNEAFLPIAINHPPDVPDVQFIEHQNTFGCESVLLSFYAGGADSYNVVYKSEDMPFYIVESVPTGQHTYAITGLNEFLDYEFIVEASNQYGFSVSTTLVREKCKYTPQPDDTKVKIVINPNPATNHIDVSTKNGEAIHMMHVYRVNDSAVLGSVTGGAFTLTLNMDVHALSPGLYSVEVITADGRVGAESFIKQ